MLTLRKSAERGHANPAWVDSFQSPSFAGCHDSDWMGGSRAMNRLPLQTAGDGRPIQSPSY